MNYNKVKRNNLTAKRPNYFQKRQRLHDPLLALNMSIFNFEGGWNRIFNGMKIRENN
jgi:hypothetical protein